MKNIIIEKIHPEAKLPIYAHGPQEDAGADLHTVQDELIPKGITTLVKTGLKIYLEPGIEAQIRTRSGMAKKFGLVVANSPGTIDPSYRGEIGVLVYWHGFTSSNDDGIQYIYTYNQSGLFIPKGTRIAQMVVAPYIPANFVEKDENFVETQVSLSRGENGFGSTGV